jgi:hypothetical protein
MSLWPGPGRKLTLHQDHREGYESKRQQYLQRSNGIVAGAKQRSGNLAGSGDQKPSLQTLSDKEMLFF